MRRPRALPELPAGVVWSLSREPSGVCVAVCDTLALTLEARDQARVSAAIPAAHRVLLEDLRATGDLDPFLQARGWSPPRAAGPGPFGLSWFLTGAGERGSGSLVRTSAVEVALRVLGFSPVAEVGEWVVNRHSPTRRRLLLPQASRMDMAAAQNVLRQAGLSCEGQARFFRAGAVPVGGFG